MFENIKTQFENANIGVKLIFIQVVLFFVFLITNYAIRTVFFIDLTSYFILDDSFSRFIYRPWTLLTYMFLHEEIMHLLFNMVFLYFITDTFLRYFRSRNLLTFYLFGGIFGGIFFMLFARTFNYQGSVLLGASAAIYALFFAIISYMPQMPIRLMFLPITFPIMYLGLVFIGFDVYDIIVNHNPGGHVSHLGGALFGYIYMKQFEKGNDFLGDFLDKILNVFKKKSHLKVHKNNSFGKKMSDEDFNTAKISKQKKIDTILDKISRSGYDSLSKEEKDFLFKEGR